MNETWLEKTELYINGGMSDEERSLFEEEMSVNEELSSYVSLYRNIEMVMRNKEKNNEQEEALKESIKKLNAVYFNAPTESIPETKQTKTPIVQPIGTSKKTWKTLAIAAVTIGIVLMGIPWYLKEDRKPNEQITANSSTDTTLNMVKRDTAALKKNIAPGITAQNETDTGGGKKASITTQQQELLFADNFKPDAVPDDTEGPLDDGFTYYSDHKYAAAAYEFEHANKSEETRGLGADTVLTAFYASYYAGISYLTDNKINKAIPALNNALTKSISTLYAIKTQWYLALAYLKTGETDKATELLTKIASNTTETEYRSKAGALLTELK
jgi:tetratricopeptide (TPR) repeat protein